MMWNARDAQKRGIGAPNLNGFGGKPLGRLGACQTLVLYVKREVNLSRTAVVAGENRVRLQQQPFRVVVVDIEDGTGHTVCKKQKN